MAITHGFSVESERPHAPGSPLFVEAWSALHSLLDIEPHTAIVLLNCILYAASIILCFGFARRLFSLEVAVLATTFFAFNPVTIYFASIAEIYIYDAFFALTILYLVRFLPARHLWLSAFLFGVAGGFRLSSLFLLLPAILVIMYARRNEFSIGNIALRLFTLCAGFALWIIPYYYSSTNGFQPLVRALTGAGDLSSTIGQNLAALASWAFWGLNLALILFLWKTPAILRRIQLRNPNTLLLTAWIFPPLLFFIVSHYAKGYILLILPAIAMVFALAVIRYTRIRLATATIVTGVTGILLFILPPFMPPAAEASLPKDQRTSSERLETAVLRTFSFFAPTYAHITESEHAITEARAMLSQYCKSRDVVFVDPSAGSWAFPRSLQSSHPDLYFIAPSENNTVTIYHDSGILRQQPLAEMTSQDSVYYLVDKRLLSSQPVLETGTRVALIRTDDSTMISIFARR